ncbi:hypothetical protein K3495_g5952 [Podosphaera aphanis]|nr:hypothetical protein K3495_g5952 [Podosphaera aphanis]
MESPSSEASLDSHAFDVLNGPCISPSYFELHDVVKSSESASENLYVVEEATVLFPTNNPQRANVLTQAKPNRKLRLHGRIVVDNDQEDQLISYEDGITLNGEWIIYEGDFSHFSIAFPNTLWIPTHLGHLEVRSSREYHDIFTEMMHAIGIFYVAIFHYEEYGEKDGYDKDYNHMTAILNFYAVHVDGRGLFFKEVIGITTKYATFMLNEYKKELAKGSLLGNHMFFNWLKDGCKVNNGIPVARIECQEMSPEQYHQYFEKARLRMKREYGSPEPPSPVLLRQATNSPGPSAVQANISTSVSSSTSSATMNKPYHGNYESPQFPNGVQVDSSIPEKIAALICHAVSSGRQQLQKLTISNVGGALYRDYSVYFRQVCIELVILYRSSVLDYLPKSTSWENSELYRELSSSDFPSAIPISHHDLEKMQKSIRGYLDGSRRLVHRGNKFPTSISSAVTLDKQTVPQYVADPFPILPNRDPAIISLSTSLEKNTPYQIRGIKRAAYGDLGMYN